MVVYYHDSFADVVSAAVIVGIAFSGLAACLVVICCGVVCLYRFRLLLNFALCYKFV